MKCPPPPTTSKRIRNILLVVTGTLFVAQLAVTTLAEPLTGIDKLPPSSGNYPSYGMPAQWDAVSPERLLEFLPADLPSEKRELSRVAIYEAAPRLQELSTAFISVYDELRELSFNSDTPPEALTKLGQKLSHSRKALRKELHKLNGRLEHITGYNLKLDDPGLPKTPMAKRLRAKCPPE